MSIKRAIANLRKPNHKELRSLNRNGMIQYNRPDFTCQQKPRPFRGGWRDKRLCLGKAVLRDAGYAVGCQRSHGGVCILHVEDHVRMRGDLTAEERIHVFDVDTVCRDYASSLDCMVNIHQDK